MRVFVRSAAVERETELAVQGAMEAVDAIGAPVAHDDGNVVVIVCHSSEPLFEILNAIAKVRKGPAADVAA